MIEMTRNQYCGVRRVVKNSEINTALIVAVTKISDQCRRIYLYTYWDISKQLTLTNTKKVIDWSDWFFSSETGLYLLCFWILLLICQVRWLNTNNRCQDLWPTVQYAFLCLQTFHCFFFVRAKELSSSQCRTV